MKIIAEGILKEWLVNRKLYSFVDSTFDVDDDEYQKYLKLADKYHPNYSDDKKSAWAIMMIVDTIELPTEEANQLPTDVAVGVTKISKSTEKLISDFKLIEKSFINLRESVDSGFKNLNNVIQTEENVNRVNRYELVDEMYLRLDANRNNFNDKMEFLFLNLDEIKKILTFPKWKIILNFSWKTIIVLLLSLFAVKLYAQQAVNLSHVGDTRIDSTYVDTLNKGLNVNCIAGCAGSVSSVVSTNNSSTTPLAEDAIFTGTSDDLLNYASINVNIFADQNSATNGISLQWSSNGTNWDHIELFTYIASTSRQFTLAPRAKFFRIVYTNGAIAQSTFRLQTILKVNINLT